MFVEAVCTAYTEPQLIMAPVYCSTSSAVDSIADQTECMEQRFPLTRAKGNTLCQQQVRRWAKAHLSLVVCKVGLHHHDCGQGAEQAHHHSPGRVPLLMLYQRSHEQRSRLEPDDPPGELQAVTNIVEEESVPDVTWSSESQLRCASS